MVELGNLLWPEATDEDRVDEAEQWLRQAAEAERWGRRAGEARGSQ